MNEKVIEQLYAKNFSVASIADEEYEELVHQRGVVLKKIENSITLCESNLVAELYPFLSAIEECVSKESFSAGFKLGIKLIAECLKD